MFKKLLLASAVFTLPMAASASDLPSKKAPQSSSAQLNSGVSGTFSLFGQYVIPDQNFDDSELNKNAFGFGGYTAVEAKIDNRLSLIGDMILDYHNETDKGQPGLSDETAFYGSVGMHVVTQINDASYGAFGLLGSGSQLESESGAAGPVGGGGLEFASRNYFVQAGGLFALLSEDENEELTIDDLYFVRGGTRFNIASGAVEVAAAYGAGDFNSEPDETSDGSWIQLAVKYEAPIAKNLNWNIGYQADRVEVESDTVDFHAIKLGLSIPFGGGDTTFSTPNFRAPVVVADDMN